MFATESERCVFGSRFLVVLLRNLADFMTENHFGREKPERVNAPNIPVPEHLFVWSLLIVTR